jgi:hypothetical protein
LTRFAEKWNYPQKLADQMAGNPIRKELKGFEFYWLSDRSTRSRTSVVPKISSNTKFTRSATLSVTKGKFAMANNYNNNQPGPHRAIGAGLFLYHVCRDFFHGDVKRGDEEVGAGRRD